MESKLSGLSSTLHEKALHVKSFRVKGPGSRVWGLGRVGFGV